MDRYIFAIFIILLISGCSLSNDKTKEYNWKYGEGYYIGDWVCFDSVSTIRNDTIFIQDTTVALVVGAFKRIDGSEVMEIQSLETKETGTYFAK